MTSSSCRRRISTREIGLAVVATTLSLVAIFVPVAFMGGMVGRFMKSFGLTMAFAIMVSLVVSFTLTPMMSSRWLKLKRRGKIGDHHVHRSKQSRIFGPIDRGYARMLEWSMAHRGVVAVLTVLVLLSSVPLFRFVNVNFFSQDDQSGFDVSVRAFEGTSLDATEVMGNRIAAAIRRIPEVDYTLLTVAGDGAGTQNSASLFVKLKPIEARERDQFALPRWLLSRCRLLRLRLRASDNGGNRIVAFMARKLTQLNLTRVQEKVDLNGPRSREGGGIINRILIIHHAVADAREPFDEPQILTRGMVRHAAVVVLRLHDERVAFPMAVRLSPPLRNRRGRPIANRDHPHLVV